MDGFVRRRIRLDGFVRRRICVGLRRFFSGDTLRHRSTRKKVFIWLAIAVVGERAFWWLRESGKRDSKKLEEILAALENSDVPAATRVSAGQTSPLPMAVYWMSARP